MNMPQNLLLFLSHFRDKNMNTAYTSHIHLEISEEDKTLIMKTLAKDLGLSLTENFTHYILDTVPPCPLTVYSYDISMKRRLNKSALWMGGLSNVKSVWIWNSNPLMENFEGSQTDLLCKSLHSHYLGKANISTKKAYEDSSSYEYSKEDSLFEE
jgi:hypothetical protein